VDSITSLLANLTACPQLYRLDTCGACVLASSHTETSETSQDSLVSYFL